MGLEVILSLSIAADLVVRLCGKHRFKALAVFVARTLTPHSRSGCCYHSRVQRTWGFWSGGAATRADAVPCIKQGLLDTEEIDTPLLVGGEDERVRTRQAWVVFEIFHTRRFDDVAHIFAQVVVSVACSLGRLSEAVDHRGATLQILTPELEPELVYYQGMPHAPLEIHSASCVHRLKIIEPFTAPSETNRHHRAHHISSATFDFICRWCYSMNPRGCSLTIN